MSDAVLISLISAIGTIIPVIITLIINIRQSKKIEAVKAKVDQVGVDVDGKMEKLLVATGALKKLEGVQEGVQQQKDEVRAAKAEVRQDARDKRDDEKTHNSPSTPTAIEGTIPLENLRVTPKDKPEK